MDIQWFPGHMAKTRRLITEALGSVDVVVELLDARIPASSKNPIIDGILKGKRKVVAFNKHDLADEAMSARWAGRFRVEGAECLFVNSLSARGVDPLTDGLRKVRRELEAKATAKGRIYRPVRAMVVGVPNVGKSSLINRISGKAAAATGDKPGVTKGKQWLRIAEGIELLDMPGILWPKFEDRRTGYMLAMTGAVKDDVCDLTEVAAALAETLAVRYPGALASRYGVEEAGGAERRASLGEVFEVRPESGSFPLGHETVRRIGLRRGCLARGGGVDPLRSAMALLDDFRGGRLGRLTLEVPGDG
ncbi:MAG: ribosome biogenesis GTPase YlqF [Oscillospiraceae bacterium]|nr:ribosome biogenesis GTPase YlqF [Oscillospiraceae bacterium]